MLARNMVVQGCACTPHGLEAVAGLEESKDDAPRLQGHLVLLCPTGAHSPLPGGNQPYCQRHAVITDSQAAGREAAIG